MFGPTRAQLVAQLLARDATIAELRARIAVLETHFDWLASHVNELKLERAALLEKCVDIRLAGVPMIQREPALPGADPNYVTPADGVVPNLGDILQKARDLVDDSRRPGAEQRNTIAGADMQGISFEDMGDEAAAAAGITHTPDGRVAYVR